MIVNLQVLRALAALAVLYHHSAAYLAKYAGLPGTTAGKAGVDVFFVLSGFIMVYISQRRPVGPGRFLTLRAFRVLPLYWATTIAFVALCLVAPAFARTDPTPGGVLQSLLFIPFDKPNGIVGPLVFLGWTLNYEVFFYVLFAAALALPSLTVSVAAACVAIAVLVAAGTASVFSPYDQTVAFSWTQPIMLEFVFGMLLALLLGHRKFRPLFTASEPATEAEAATARRIGWVCIAAAAVGFVLGGVVETGVDQAAYDANVYRTGWVRLALYAAPAVLSVAGMIALERGGRRIRSPLLLAAGNASYSIYLLHPFVLNPMLKLSRKFGAADSPAIAVATVLAAWVAVMIVGYASYRLVEKPANDGLRRWLLPRKVPSSTAA